MGWYEFISTLCAGLQVQRTNKLILQHFHYSNHIKLGASKRIFKSMDIIKRSIFFWLLGIVFRTRDQKDRDNFILLLHMETGCDREWLA